VADLRLPAGYRRGPATEDLVDEAAEHVRAVFAAESGRPFLSVEEYSTVFRAPFVDPEQDLVLVRDESGALVAQALVMNRAPFLDAGCFGVVSPAHYGRGLGGALLAWEEARVRERLPEATPGARVVMNCFTDAQHDPSVDLLTGHGFVADRYFITMETEFDGPPAVARFPDGIELREFTPDQVEAAARAAADAFRDHYGYVERPLEDRYAEIRTAIERPDFEASLWWHAYEGDEIVANCWCIGNHEGDASVGYVQSLGVRSGWRGRGIARNLLLHAFGVFHRRGKEGAALAADAQSLTGATRLYESVGMRETFRNAVYLKEIRAGEDLATRTLD
jgi:GNAT superfamily N-acetyltransferase